MKSSLAFPSFCMMNTARKLGVSEEIGLPVRLLDAAVEHLYEYGSIFRKFYHQLLGFLHLLEPSLLDCVRIVEE